MTDWEGLNDCVSIVWKLSRRYRLGGDVKEKYATLRWYISFGHLSLHSLVYPGYVYNQFPNWLWKLDCVIISPALRFLFEKSFVKWQMFCYNRIYQHIMKRYPHLRAEILCSADYPELIKGATRVEGNKTHILGWSGEILSTWVSLDAGLNKI